MYSRVVVPIDAEMNFARLHDELMEKGAALLTDTLPRIVEGLQPEIQKESEATFATLLTKEMAKIDWNRPAQEVHDRVRGFDPVPGAFTYLPDGKLLKIWETRVTGNRTEALPGTVVSVTKKDFSVACRDGELRILTVQPESKKRMPAAVFLNGRGVTAGDRFGSKE
jgi:methionyl-tRNA formyltransferase